MKTQSIWQSCRNRLREELPEQQFDEFIRPLQARQGNNGTLSILAPNRYVQGQVSDDYLSRIEAIIEDLDPDFIPDVTLRVGSLDGDEHSPDGQSREESFARDNGAKGPLRAGATRPTALHAGGTGSTCRLNQAYVFDTFVEGKSTELAKAAAMQVVENIGTSYNPLLLYGGVGLGKTHLAQAVGNAILAKQPKARVLYLYSKDFVESMVDALGNNTIQDLMRAYGSVDALLLDDVQFFAAKMRSQEEIFHVFNALIQNNGQMVLTCDRYPRDLDRLEERLKSRFVGGLTVELEPPDLETRAAILVKKAEMQGAELSEEVALYIADRMIRANVRELEGALQRVIATSNVMKVGISIESVRRALGDLFAAQERQVRVDTVQEVVADYYNIKRADLLSPKRTRTLARPRQMAMCLTKELTRHSYPEIGDRFGGRDHSTVIHACRTIHALRDSDPDIAEDYKNLIRQLSSR